ncbi:hypothetical protein GGH96_004116 [Coemansia sp. RSA 1972]|nr:hypothetical protein GGH96_004116 [Coemansia sp. RSA 1972]
MTSAITLISLAAAALAVAVGATPGAHFGSFTGSTFSSRHLVKRCGCGGSGFGFFPFATSFTNQFGANNNFAHFNDDTLYVNDKDATVANNNVHNFNNVNTILR